ncbi:MAG: Fic family protein [Verrucomicrobiota bacterium]|nr:Fic family protein [Verrucomicrobiota bacterium]
MPWNWELPEWPTFHYNPVLLCPLERQFLVGAGSEFAYLKTIEVKEYHRFIVEILSAEGVESSRIEGETLDRESLQSSIQHHFGIQTRAQKKGTEKESGMANLLCDVYDSFDEPLTHEMLGKWHSMLFQHASNLAEVGRYRTHPEPMQIVSHRYDSPRVFFEAPPSSKVFSEMTRFIEWFNSSRNSLSVLERAAIAHLYFENIHPFEDGNGRIGRVVAEKALSQGVGRPVLIAISKLLEKRKKEYYAALERCNRTLEVQQWVEFFAQIIVQAHADAMKLLYFILEKSKMLTVLAGHLNPRQEKVLLRLFAEGPDGFQGGLTAEKYIAITKAPRATATRDLTDLVDKGALFKTGELRHTRYWLNLQVS